MKRVSAYLLLACLIVPDAVAEVPDGAVRRLASADGAIWAAGDRGLLLRSDDGGRSWESIDAGVVANFQDIAVDAGRIYLYGGRAIVGHLDAAGAPVILRSTDGKSFEPLPTPALGWAYSGIAAGHVHALIGESSPLSPGGSWRSVSSAERWTAMESAGAGYLASAAFLTPRLGLAGGGAGRLVGLRNLKAYVERPSEQGAPPLRAVRLAPPAFAPDRWWIVGSRGTVMRGRPGGRWRSVDLSLRAGEPLLADFETIAFAEDARAWIAGGLLPQIFHTANAGATWDRLAAPSPGGVHDLLALDAETLIAGGDAGRIWRSTDGGQSWTLVRGPERVDLLMVVAAGDLSIYPAIIAHARAGSAVTVCYATCGDPDGAAPSDQFLRAAAVSAGASGVVVLDDFPTFAAASPGIGTDEFLRVWSARLDIPAGPELARQLASVIRLHRPRVLAAGPDGDAPSGRRAENQLISRDARGAARRAAAAEGPGRIGGEPHRADRVFTALPSAGEFAAPWQDADRPRPDEYDLMLDGTLFPRGAATNVEMLAAAAGWRLPWTALTDRPPRRTFWRCDGEAGRLALMTDGLTDHRPAYRRPAPGEERLASAADLRLAATAGRLVTALGPTVKTLRRAEGDDPLAADRLMLLWWRLTETGRLSEARDAEDALLAAGAAHPLFARFNVATLAREASAEWQAQLHLHNPALRPEPGRLERAVDAFAAWTVWNAYPSGRYLLARCQAKLGRDARARQALEAILASDAGPAWQTCAALALGELSADSTDRAHLPAGYVAEPGKIDGKLDEPCWARAKALPLTAGGNAGEGVAGTIRAVRTAGDYAIFGIELPDRMVRVWSVDIAIDADRDGWTQLVLHCETDGTRSARLRCRVGPAAELDTPAFLLQGQRTDDGVTLEIAVPLAHLGADNEDGPWLIQVRAAADEYGHRRTLYLQPQGDERLLPERYGLLTLPARPAER